MVSTYTPNKNIEKPGNNDYIDTWDVPVNNNSDIIDTAFSGTHIVSLTSSNVTLTQDEAQNVCIKLTGTLTANVTVYFPNGVAGFYIVDNSTSGSYTVTLSSDGGGPYSAAAVQNANTFIWHDGTDVFLADNAPITGGVGITVAGTSVDLDVPVSVNHGGTGNTVYSNGQVLIGNSSGGLTKTSLTAGSNVTITNGDGTITIAASVTPTTGLSGNVAWLLSL